MDNPKRGEVWLVDLGRSGVFDAQNNITIPKAKLIRKLGKLFSSDLSAVEDAVRLWLGLKRISYAT